MSAFFIFILTSFLLFLCAITVLFILMQRPSEESGMGATLGGSAVTSIFGGEGINTLARITKYCVAIFFTLSFFLSLLHMALEKIDRPQNLLEKKEVVAAAVDVKDNEKIPLAETISGFEAADTSADALLENQFSAGTRARDENIGNNLIEDSESVI
ncbi:MAG: preprotein translocase subunit SecG [Puniceicoccales bacterium]|jgi:protein translocase SecG subunit|nr:preprotein translocase subunit SecG [Puniceicoccales bacterium]